MTGVTFTTGIPLGVLATSAVGSCPLYTLFGLRTCPVQRLTPAGERTASR